MKKVSLLILVSLILLLAFASCDQLPPLFGEEPEPEHVHDWMEATCEAPKTCACGATEGEALPHTWTEATCEAPKVCTFCNKTEGTALNHKWAAADCETPATCTLCGTTSGEALGHVWISASCNSAKHCAKCNIEEGEPLEHVWVEATCLTPKTCTLCQTTEGEALGHANETVPGYAATCTANGLTDGAVCTRCNQVTLAQQVIAPLGHTAAEEWVKVADPTCNDAGLEKLYCTVEGCGAVIDTRAIDPNGHTWQDADCVTAKTCKVCGATTGKPLGHTGAEAVKENEVAPTCTVAGSYESVVYCSACKVELSRETVAVDALGHTGAPAVKENEVAPTCTANGSYESVVYCSVCGVELSRETKPVDALGHDMAPATHTAPATCKNNCGYTEGTAVENHKFEREYEEGQLYYWCAVDGCDSLYIVDEALVYDGSKNPQFAVGKTNDVNHNIGISVNADGQYVVAPKDNNGKYQYMMYFPSNDKGNANIFNNFNGDNNAVGVISFKMKTNTFVSAKNGEDAVRIIVMAARNTPHWDANGAWNGNSIDVLSIHPNYDGTYKIYGNNITGETFATVAADEWFEVQMFMQLTDDHKFVIAYYINGVFFNTYERDLDTTNKQSLKDYMIQCAYVCGYTEGTDHNLVFDDFSFGYTRDAEWVFDNHKHTMTAANCTSPSKCTACGLTEGAALGHDLVNHEGQAATCTEKGWKAYQTCTRCSHTTYEEIAPLKHAYGSATCDQAATCERCGATSGQPIGHAFGDYVYNKDATCSADGTKTAKCTRDNCNATDTQTAEGTKLSHSFAEATCAAPKTCTLCGATEGKANTLKHDKLTVTNQKGLALYSCATCGYSCRVDLGDYADGSNYNGMSANAPDNKTYYTTNKDNDKMPVMTGGYYEFVRKTDAEGAANTTRAQLQMWLPDTGGVVNKYAGFTSANNAVGFLSFKINAYTDSNLEIKLVDHHTDNIDTDGDGVTERIRWGDLWAINDPVFRVQPPANGKAQILGFNGTVLATVNVDENNYTGWVDVAIQIVLDPETDTVIANYYISGAYVTTQSRPLTIHSNAITGVYINSNNTTAGTGYKIDNLAFGYSVHKHDYDITANNGVLTLTCDCGTSYKVEDAFYNDGTEQNFYYSKNGAMLLTPKNGVLEAIFAPTTDKPVGNQIVKDDKKESQKDLDENGKETGWVEYGDSGNAGGQHMWWTHYDDKSGIQSLKCADNATGLVSFKMQTNVDTGFWLSLCKERGTSGFSWGTAETKALWVGPYSENGIEIKDRNNKVLATIPVENGWSEWFEVQISIQLHDNGTYDFYYYVNGAYVGALIGQTMNIDTKDFRSVYINGWTYTANTGLKIDDLIFGATKNGHNTLDGEKHNLTETNCGEKSVCSCGWTGYTIAHDLTPATCGAPATCKGCGMTEGVALTHNYLASSKVGDNVYYTCSDCGKFYILDGGKLGMSQMADATAANTYNKTNSDGLLSLTNATTSAKQHQLWVPGMTEAPALAGFTNANGALGFISFKVNAKNHNTSNAGGIGQLEFKINANRGKNDWNGPTNNGWTDSSVAIFAIQATNPSDTKVKLSGYGGKDVVLGTLDMTGENGWTGWIDVVIMIQLNKDNTVSINYYINGEFFATLSGAMKIWTNEINSLYINGYTAGEGEGYQLKDLAFGYTLNGLQDPLYNNNGTLRVTEIAKENVTSEALKTINEAKIKQYDQSNPAVEGNSHGYFTKEGGTARFVSVYKDGEYVEAIYFSRTKDWGTYTEKEQNSKQAEHRYMLDKESKVAKIEFDYLVNGSFGKHPNTGENILQLKLMDAKNNPVSPTNQYWDVDFGDDVYIEDGQWHHYSYTLETPYELECFLIILREFQGEFLLANLEVTYA